MQRCSICGGVYPADEMSERDGKRFCLLCDTDEYSLRDEDIPF
jgi:formylmethanofuran dehydrogenase subunit E